MPTEKWEKPIEVSFVGQDSRIVGGPFEALICLTEGWPDMRGIQFLRARSKCRAALAGRSSAEEARSEFLAAVREVEMIKH